MWPARSCQLHKIHWSSWVMSKQNNIFWVFCLFLWFLWFLSWWSLQRGQLKKSPCRCKKTLQNPNKLAIYFILDLDSCPLLPWFFIKRCTMSKKFKTFRHKLSVSRIYSSRNFLEFSRRFLQNIALQNPKKLAISLKLNLEHCPLIPWFFIKRYTMSINFERFRQKMSISWIYFETNLASYLNLLNPFSRLIKTVCNKSSW